MAEWERVQALTPATLMVLLNSLHYLHTHVSSLCTLVPSRCVDWATVGGSSRPAQTPSSLALSQFVASLACVHPPTRS